MDSFIATRREVPLEADFEFERQILTMLGFSDDDISAYESEVLDAVRGDKDITLQEIAALSDDPEAPNIFRAKKEPILQKALAEKGFSMEDFDEAVDFLHAPRVKQAIEARAEENGGDVLEAVTYVRERIKERVDS